MHSMSAHEAKARFGQLLDAARDGPVAINKHGRDVAVVISKEEFDVLTALKLEALRAGVQKGFDSIGRGDSLAVSTEDLAALGTVVKSRGRKRHVKK
jgi:prevent-host-death family protein